MHYFILVDIISLSQYMYVDLQCSSHQNAAILNFLLIFLFSQAELYIHDVA